MKKTIYLVILLLIESTLHCEIKKMDEFIIKEDRTYRTIDCNLLISLNRTVELCGTEIYHFKKIELSGIDKSILRCYVIDAHQNQKEITSSSKIYDFTEIYNNSILKINQPDYNIYAILENNKINKEVSMAECIEYYNKLINKIKSTIKKESSLSFLNHISITNNKTKADELVLVSNNTEYLSKLKNEIGGNLKDNILRINTRLVNLKKTYLSSNKITVFFPWRADTDLPQIKGQQVYYPIHTFENKLIGKKSRILIPIISNN